MPKYARAPSSIHQHRQRQQQYPQVYVHAMDIPASVEPSQVMDIGYSSRPNLPLRMAFYSTMPSSVAAPPSMQPQYMQHFAPLVPVSIPHRASSGAWSSQDNQNLLSARQQGLSWKQIRNTYFPNKTPNACRKRYERLMEREGANCDVRKFEKIAKEYVGMRKEIWQSLANKFGETWIVVEARCINSGLKNVQNAARAGSRRERAESG